MWHMDIYIYIAGLFQVISSQSTFCRTSWPRTAAPPSATPAWVATSRAWAAVSVAVCRGWWSCDSDSPKRASTWGRTGQKMVRKHVGMWKIGENRTKKKTRWSFEHHQAKMWHMWKNKPCALGSTGTIELEREWDCAGVTHPSRDLAYFIVAGITNQMFTSIGIKYPTEHHRTHVLLLGWNNITETINHGGVEQDNKGVGLTWINMD